MENKLPIFDEAQQLLNSLELRVQIVDRDRPWGGFYVVDEADTEKFINHFFPLLDKSELLKGKLSPKLLLVAPHRKLSWQYHFRRSEIWKLIRGEAAVVKSETDEEADTVLLNVDDIITLKQGERHRLVGLDQWGIVAEIWIHTDQDHPSDEDDIVRLQDDFGR